MDVCGSSQALDALFAHIHSPTVLQRPAPSAPAIDRSTLRAAGSSTRNTAVLDHEWTEFIAPKPRSQIQALPPFARWHSNASGSFSSGDGWDDTSGSWTDEYASWSDSDDYDSFPDSSARWSPEVETAIEATRRSGVSPALSATSYTSVVPSSDEAFRVCCERGRLLLADCCDRARGLSRRSDDANDARRDEGSPHPLTFFASTETEWNFRRIFKRNGLSRITCDPSDDIVDLDEPPDPKLSIGGDRAFELLHKTAMSRLAAVTRHLDAAVA